MSTNFRTNNNGRRWVFSEATFKKVNLALVQLVTHLKADIVIFADQNGYPISYNGKVDEIDVNNLTALSAGTFSATAEMASLIQEKEHFRYIFHEGSLHNLYLCTVGSDYLMILVFQKETALGLVRALTHSVIAKLEELVEDLKKETQTTAQVLDNEFKSLLSKELDKTFGL
jgi:predicted regulator of Ras-like GTPase activity (Roadblock/LC7/MglB family)